MKTKFVLREEKEFLDYKDKLDEIENSTVPHVGSPRRYPCLAISEFSDEPMVKPEWKHLFIYSNHPDDLRAILNTVDDAGIKKILASQKAKEAEEPQKGAPAAASTDSDWEKLWNEVEVGVREPRSTLKQQQFDEYEDAREKIAKLPFSEAIKVGKAYLQRWPNSHYMDLIILMLRERQRQYLGLHGNHNNDVSTSTSAQTTTTEDGVHDYYPGLGARSPEPEVIESKDPPEPRSRISREVRFVNHEED